MAPEKFVIAFWRDSSHFPNIVASTVEQRMRVYWTCIATFAASLRRYHSVDCEICVATNDAPPDDIAHILDALNVDRVFVPFRNAESKGEASFGAAWYLIDVISHSAAHANDDQVLVFIDPDCLVTGPLDNMIAQIREGGLLLFEMNLPMDQDMNGLSRADLRKIANLDNAAPNRALPMWIGGEIIAGTGAAMRSVVQDFIATGDMLAATSAATSVKTEEQFLSLVFHRSGRPYIRGYPEHICRIWTTGRYRNYAPNLLSMAIWHLPSEKMRGFPKTLGYLTERAGQPVVPAEVNDLARLMSLRGPTLREVFYILRTCFSDIISSFRGRIVNYRRD